MDMNFKDEDISSLYKMLIELGGAQEVDDSPDKYVRKKDDGSVAYITTKDGETYNLAIYGTHATDALIINPLAEGDADSAINSWFTSSINLVLSANIANAFRVLLRAGADSHKKGKKDGDGELALKAAKYLSKDVEDIDEKMTQEFEHLCKPITNFFNVYYNRNKQKGEVKCPIFTVAQRKGVEKKIRVKTWEVWEHILARLLGTSKLEDFDYVPGNIGIPAFESFANIIVKLYETLQEPFEDLLGLKVEHLEEIKSHLKYLPQYYAKAKWCVGPQGTLPKAQSQTTTGPAFTPWATPICSAPVQAPAPAPMPAAQPTPQPQVYQQPVPMFQPMSPFGNLPFRPFA